MEIEKKMGRICVCVLICLIATLNVSARSREKISECPQFGSISEMLEFAEKQMHKPYRNGAEGPNAFDCSGFTRFCFKRLGITLKRTSKDQTDNGKKVRFKRNLKEGDLVFFRGSKGRKVGHVGIVISKGEGKSFRFIHASPTHGIVIENSEVKYFKKRYKKARRITSNRDIGKAIKYFSREKENIVNDDLYRSADPEQPVSKQHDKTNGVKTHTVVKGDTLYNISQRYKCSVEDLKRWNSLKGNAISIGQELTVGE